MAIAERAGDLLDYKRRELASELRRLGTVRRRAALDLEDALEEVRRSLAAIDTVAANAVVGVASDLGAPAELHVEWRAVMGVRYPTSAAVAFAPPSRLSALPGGAALHAARDAHRRALSAAVAAAAAESAHARIAAEWERTTRAARALELRAVPAHRQALAALELRLDEREREDALRVRWAGGRSDDGGT